MAEVRVVSYGPEATDALRAAIVAAKGGDALAPVTVAVPLNYAGLSLRAVLSNVAPVANTRFLVFSRVAELLGAPLLAEAGCAPLTPWIRSEAIRAALREQPGVFAGVSEHPATAQSLASTFKDLRFADDAGLARAANGGPRQADVVHLFRRFRELTAAFYDEEDLLDAAVRAARAGSPAERDLGHVIVFVPRPMRGSEVALLELLGKRGMATVIAGLTGDPLADAPMLETVELLRIRGFDVETPVATPTVPAGTHVASVSDPEEEVRLVLRMVARDMAEGVPLHRIGVLYGQDEPYQMLTHEQFRGAGVPHNGAAVQTLAQSVAGRMLLGLLRLAPREFARDDVMAWLTCAPIVEAERGTHAGELAPAPRWDALSRDAGVVHGRTQWLERLGRHEARLAARREDEDEDDDERRKAMAPDIDLVARLRVFVADLFNGFRSAQVASAATFADEAGALLDRYLGGDHLRAAWSEAELQAREAIEGHLEAIARLGKSAVLPTELQGNVSRDTFADALAELLGAPGPRVGGFGDGVFLGPLSAATGMDFERVYVLGMAEGQLPTIGANDPLLTDDERRDASSDLPLRAERRADERRGYLAALAAGRQRTLLYARADLRGQSANLPSRWLVETASALHGSTLFTSGFAGLDASAAPWLTVVKSFQAALDGDPAAGKLPVGSLQERDLASLSRSRAGTGHYLFSSNARLRDGIEAAQSRMPGRKRLGGRQKKRDGARELSRWEGGVGKNQVPPPSSASPSSPTALESFAACPFRYFLSHVLRVSELQKPEDTLRIAASDRGTLIHTVLERFFKETLGRPDATAPWSREERQRLAEIGAEECAKVEERGLTGRGLLWEVDQKRILRDLMTFLDYDERWRVESGFVFAQGELAFGTKARPSEARVPYPAVAVPTTAGTIAFRGKIDRVDRHPDGRIAVIDYKSGSAFGFEGVAGADAQERLDAGKRLQLPIYALAAEQALAPPPGTEVQALYWFVSEAAQFEQRGYTVTAAEAELLASTLATFAGTIKAGLFPANPGKPDQNKPKNCRFCDYDSICQAGDRIEAWNERQRSVGLEGYIALTPVEDRQQEDVFDEWN